MIRFIKTLFKTIFKVRNSKEWITLTFYRKTDKRWYVYLPWWIFKKEHLEMVSYAADFLDYLEEEYLTCPNRKIRIKFKQSNKELNLENTYKFELINSHLTRGSFYEGKDLAKGNKLYLCPVTLFVLGHYPKYIYVNEDMTINGNINDLPHTK